MEFAFEAARRVGHQFPYSNFYAIKEFVRRRVAQVSFGRELRFARARRGFTMAELAQRSAISQASLSRIENGLTHPAFGDVCAICKALGIPLLLLAEGRERGGDSAPDLIAQLEYWGLSDLDLAEKPVFGESRSFEDLLASAVDGKPDPRILEAIPALLLKNDYEVDRLMVLAKYDGIEARLGWLAEVALSLADALPITCVHPDAIGNLHAVVSATWPKRLASYDTPAPHKHWDALGEIPDSSRTAIHEVPTLARKWRIQYKTSIEDFRHRAREILGVERDA